MALLSRNVVYGGCIISLSCISSKTIFCTQLRRAIALPLPRQQQCYKNQETVVLRDKTNTRRKYGVDCHPTPPSEFPYHPGWFSCPVLTAAGETWIEGQHSPDKIFQGGKRDNISSISEHSQKN